LAETLTTRVVFLDRASLKAKLRHFAFPAEYIEHQKTDAAEIVARLDGATIAIVNKVPIRADTLRQLPQLKMIAVAATGYDVVDISYCNEHGIAVANIRNYAVHTVPEHAFAMILALRRNLLSYRQDVEAGVWNKSEQFCFFTHDIGDLHGATLGIIGEGAIGQVDFEVYRGRNAQRWGRRVAGFQTEAYLGFVGQSVPRRRRARPSAEK
jgi:glycerate dehydrogenase